MSASNVDSILADDGSTVTLRRADLPTIANVRAFEIRMTLEEIEALYHQLRARSLGADSTGEL